MRSVKSYNNTSHGIMDVMTHGARRTVRLSQTDVRRAREYFSDIMPGRYSGRSFPKGILDLAVFNKAADFTGISASAVLTWVCRKFGKSAVAGFAEAELGMTHAARKAKS